MQDQLTRYCGAYNLPNEDALREMVMAISSEAGEAMAPIVTKTKPWKSAPIDWSHIDEEMIDIFHFLLEYWLLRGFTPDEIFKQYQAKNEYNYTRVKAKLNSLADNSDGQLQLFGDLALGAA